MKNKKYYIWGTGALAKQFSQFYGAELGKLNFCGYIDNSSEKWGKEFFGKPIYAPDILKSPGEKNIIIPSKYKEEIIKQIRKTYAGDSCQVIPESFMEVMRKNPEGIPSADTSLVHQEPGHEEEIIYGQIMGGLGNQLFIYAFCKQLVEILNRRAILYYDSGDGRYLEITAFPLDTRITIIPRCFANEMKEKGLYQKFSSCCRMIDALPSQQQKLSVGRLFHKQGVIYINEGYGRLDYRALRKQKQIIFQGYMQSERFFSQVSDALRRELAVPRRNESESTGRTDTWIQNIQSTESVCIHIRWGDYLSDQFKDRFLVCTDDYYRKAVARMKERVPGAKYYVFSDSIEWVRENMEYIRELEPIYVDNGGEQAVLDDFLMMKACRHFIMSNSTFSWWAQYLGTAPDKIVIAPSKWLNYGYGNQDIYQDNWELIDV